MKNYRGWAKTFVTLDTISHVLSFSLFKLLIISFLFLYSFSTLSAQRKALFKTVSTDSDLPKAEKELALQMIKEFPNLEQELIAAEFLVLGSKNDSARLILNEIIPLLEKNNYLHSYLGLRALLADVTILEQRQIDSSALPKLLNIKKISSEKKLWYVYAITVLRLANLYEGIEQFDKTIEALNEARSAIDQYQLAAIYPRFAIRISSYMRLNNHPDSAKYFASEALRTAPTQGRVLEEAEGHLLHALLSYKDAPEKAIAHYKKAGILYNKMEYFLGAGGIYAGIARIYISNNNFKKALIYNDSTIIAIQKAVQYGHKKEGLFGSHYKRRAEILNNLGQSDSAWVYLNKGYQMDIDHLKIRERAKIVEIDARYNDEKKAQQIAQQAELLKFEKSRKNWFVAIAIFALLFAASLTYYSLRLRKVNHKIKEQAQQLKNLDIAKSRFFANISHELRTPLTLIQSPIYTLLKENKLSDKQLQLLQIANNNSQQLQHLINKILDLQKLEMGKMEINPKPTHLVELFNNYFAQFSSIAQSKQIEFSLKSNLDADIIANIDREIVRQVLFNLLSNAFKYTPKDGTIRLGISIENNHFKLTVADSGAGIHPDDLPLLFNRYFQTNQSDKPIEGGTGIGLALCNEYAHLLRGKLSAKSTLNEGSVFTFVFPIEILKDSEVVPANETLTATAILPTKTPIKFKTTHKKRASNAKILVVEDNPELAAYLQLILGTKYQLKLAKDGQEAWNTVQKHTDFQLVITDLMMPIMDGYQLLKKLKSTVNTRHIPVIMLTARAEKKDQMTALRIGVDDYIHKPFNEEELLIRIDNLLKNLSARQQAASLDNKTNKTTTKTADIANQSGITEDNQEWLETFEAFILSQLSDTTLSVPHIAKEFSMSESTLLRRLKQLTGLSTVQYLQEVRLNQARNLLEDQHYNSVAAVCQKVGYTNPSSFSRKYKNRFGKPPSAYF